MHKILQTLCSFYGIQKQGCVWGGGVRAEDSLDWGGRSAEREAEINERSPPRAAKPVGLSIDAIEKVPPRSETAVL